MVGMVQSLNVSVAAATLLFEARRQRDRAGLSPGAGQGLGDALASALRGLTFVAARGS